MRTIFKVMAAILMVATFAFSYSCKKETASPASVDMGQTGTIHGYVAAELDLTKAGNEPVKNQTVILSIPYSSFAYLTGNPKGNWTKAVTTDSTGQFTATVPTTGAGVTVTIAPVDFVYAQVQTWDAQVIASQKTISKYYTVASSTLYVSPGSIKTDTWTYSPNSNNTTTTFVQISGKAYAEVLTSNPGSDLLNGNTITLSSGTWSTSFVVNGDGTYGPILVPAGVAINANMVAANNLGATTKSYSYTKAIGSFNAYQTFMKDIDFSTGTPLVY